MSRRGSDIPSSELDNALLDGFRGNPQGDFGETPEWWFLSGDCGLSAYLMQPPTCLLSKIRTIEGFTDNDFPSCRPISWALERRLKKGMRRVPPDSPICNARFTHVPQPWGWCASPFFLSPPPPRPLRPPGAASPRPRTTSFDRSRCTVQR